MFRIIEVKQNALLGFSFMLSLALALPARGTVLTFDDTALGPISYVYHGLLFGSSAENGVENSASSPLSGVRNSAVSAPNVYVSDPGIASMFAFTNPVFTLNSSYFTSATDQTLTLDALGIFADDSRVHKLFTINEGGPTLVQFDWAKLKEVQITGTAADVDAEGQFVMDNVTIDAPVTPEPPPVTGTPEPQVVFLTASGLLLLALSRCRSSKISHRAASDE